jgi:aerobic carbon-monoxide dehydrogenase medium subunit
VIPAAFDYEVADSVDHAIATLTADDDARLLAGGHSLVPAMRLRLARPSMLVDIGRLSELTYVREAGDHVAIGALTRHKDVASSDLLQSGCAVVAQTAAAIGDPQVRHRGTIGGSLAHGDPASDLPAVLLALGAELVARGPDGERVIPAAAFFTGPFETALAHDELLVEVRVPKLADGAGASYLKAHRRAQDWATVGVAVVAHRSNGGVDAAAIALASMGGTPLRATAAEEALTGGASPADAAALAADGTSPPSDHAASSEYRAHLARVLTARAIEHALG